MSRRQWHAFLIGSYLMGAIDSSINMLCLNRMISVALMSSITFFCDTPTILALSYSDTYVIEIIIIIVFRSSLMVSLLTISVSYASILSTILKINSISGKQKAFSTCASHLLGVTVFYSTLIFTYLKPTKSYSLGKEEVASVFYTIVIPMLNPLIYSLRNKEVKSAVVRLVKKRQGSRKLI